MSSRFRTLETLATERNKSVGDMEKILGDKGIVVVNGLYDSVLFEAIFTAPSKADGGLSSRTGLGAVQSLVEPLGVRVLVHDVHRAQTLVFRKGTKNTIAKWLYIGQTFGNVYPFSVRGFLNANAPTHFFLTCFEGPHAWVATRQQLAREWKLIKEKGNDPEDASVRVPSGSEDSESGHLVLRLKATPSKYFLQTAKQLGF